MLDIHGFRVGNSIVSPALALAPMSGVTNRAFRRLIRQENPGAVGLYVTEFISIEALVRHNSRSLEMMLYDEAERPVSVQIFGADPEHMVEAAKMVEDAGADILDINCGCPVPKVVRRGGGCELMRQPEHLEHLLRLVVKAVSIPVTLKMRSGWSNESRNAVQIARLAENAGVQMLAVHGRTRKDLYRGTADWDIVRDVCRAVQVPVFGSGDVIDAESAESASRSGVQGLMIGRGALMNPWIFTDLQRHFQGLEPIERAPQDIVHVQRRYLKLLREELPEKAVLGRLKQFATRACRMIRGSSEARTRLCRSQSVDEFLGILDEWEEYLETGKRVGRPTEKVAA